MEGFEADPRMKFTPGDFTEHWARMAENGWAWSVAFGDGRIAGACGLYLYDEENPRHAEMWAVFSREAGKLMLGATRRSLAVLDAARGNLDRIQARVGRSFPQGRKWVLLLGFAPTGETLVTDADVFDLYVWKG